MCTLLSVNSKTNDKAAMTTIENEFCIGWLHENCYLAQDETLVWENENLVRFRSLLRVFFPMGELANFRFWGRGDILSAPFGKKPFFLISDATLIFLNRSYN